MFGNGDGEEYERGTDADGNIVTLERFVIGILKSVKSVLITERRLISSLLTERMLRQKCSVLVTTEIAGIKR